MTTKEDSDTVIPMKAIKFCIDFCNDLVDCIAYIPTPLYHELHNLFKQLGGNEIEWGFELEDEKFSQACEMITSYAALCACMYYASTNSRDYMWDSYCSMDCVSFTQEPHKFDVELYAKSLFYSQWRIEDYIVNRIILHNPDRKKYIRRITREHNQRYKESYLEWRKLSSKEEYVIEQYKREIDERVNRHKITVLDLDEYAKKFIALQLPERHLMVLLRKLDNTFYDISLKMQGGRMRERSYASEYGCKREIYKAPLSASIRAISTPMGGLNKRR